MSIYLSERQAGLFSAVATAFINQTSSQLQPDPGDVTNALLRVLIYKIDNTTFGENVPTLPQPTGVSAVMSLAQLILFLSLGLSLLCATMAMLCKDWLNRYTWTDVEGSVIEHSHNRQGKVDGVYDWHFLSVLDFLQVMLQSSLFLFGCGLLGSLWEANAPAAGAIIALISFGILIFASILIAGRVSDSCPYQTSASAQPRTIWERVESIIHPTAMLETRSISWVLRKSLNAAVRLSAFKYLVSIPELPQFYPDLVETSFHIFMGCISLDDDKVAIKQGSEQLATMSARGLFRTLHRLWLNAPSSYALRDIRRCYDGVFPPSTDFRGLPFHRQMTMIHIAMKKCLSPGPVEWNNDELSTQERIPLAWYMAEAARIGYKETKGEKVPRWILRFALDSLPLDPPSPPSVIANCLEIIAIDLDCNVSSITTKDERCVRGG